MCNDQRCDQSRTNVSSSPSIQNHDRPESSRSLVSFFLIQMQTAGLGWSLGVCYTSLNSVASTVSGILSMLRGRVTRADNSDKATALEGKGWESLLATLSMFLLTSCLLHLAALVWSSNYSFRSPCVEGVICCYDFGCFVLQLYLRHEVVWYSGEDGDE